MLERVDAHDGDVGKVASADYRRVVDLCWQCKLCFNHCPYTPPHRFDIDFPRLMLRAKAARARAEGVSRQDAWLGNVDAVGALGSAAAPLSNWANRLTPHRALMEAVLGIDRSRNLPRFHHKTFARWFRERERERTRATSSAERRIHSGATPGGARGGAPPHPPAQVRRPIVFFHTCVVNYNEPQVGRDAVAVLEKNGCAVASPDQVCCGMPYLDGGDIDAAVRNARRNVDALLPLVEQGAEVVVPQPTCSYVLKKEYPMLVPGAAAERVAGRTRDLFEYLAGRHREGSLATDFPGRRPGKVAYQMPCHLRAQNMGYKTRDVLQLIPGTKVTVVERCTAMDGTWGMKKEFYPISLEFARKAVLEMDAAEPETYATDCSMAALQLEQVKGIKPAHPASLLREAYGLPEEH
jgi:Fe-S oxidoreductase